MGPDGLYLEAQILEKTGAKSIMNREFKTEKHTIDGIDVKKNLSSQREQVVKLSKAIH